MTSCPGFSFGSVLHDHTGLVKVRREIQVWATSTPMRTLMVSPFGPERVRLMTWSVAILELGYTILQPSHRTSEVVSRAISSTCRVKT